MVHVCCSAETMEIFIGRLHMLLCLFLVVAANVRAYPITPGRHDPTTTLVQLEQGADVEAHRRWLTQENLDSAVIHWYDLGPEFQGYALRRPFASLGTLRFRQDVQLAEPDATADIGSCQEGAPWHLARISQPNFPQPQPNIYTYSYGEFCEPGITPQGPMTMCSPFQVHSPVRT